MTLTISDVVEQMLSLKIGSSMMEDLPPTPANAYAAIQREVELVQIITDVGLTANTSKAVFCSNPPTAAGIAVCNKQNRS